ncbi:hypothetical protein HPB49_003397 [Dermacentor silvarum]|uniref:Uncharacterized protein n=1 Tax=Dermacentor silvarum TaxID=543639 RepID=A0ACB8CPM2_DERSI|nr:hypothetical protein HPB49_003397 [Dermacentor silvarum]
METAFGWTLQGMEPTSSVATYLTSTGVMRVGVATEPDEISPQLRSFWELEHPGIVDDAQPTGKDDNVRRAFEENIAHKHGRYEVTPPRRENAADLTDINSTTEPLMNLEDHSSLTRVRRVTTWVRLFIQNCRSQSKLTGELMAEEVADAEMIWKRVCQLDTFRNDVRALRAARLLDRGSSVIGLSPFLAADGIMRVGGRLHFGTEENGIIRRNTYTWVAPTSHPAAVRCLSAMLTHRCRATAGLPPPPSARIMLVRGHSQLKYSFCCSNRSDSSRRMKKPTNTNFFRIRRIVVDMPERSKTLSSNRRTLWLARINGADLDPQKPNLLVCGADFVTGTPSDFFDSTNPDWAPSLHLGYSIRQADADRYERSELRWQRKRGAEAAELAAPEQPCGVAAAVPDVPPSPQQAEEVDAREEETG